VVSSHVTLQVSQIQTGSAVTFMMMPQGGTEQVIGISQNPAGGMATLDWVVPAPGQNIFVRAEAKNAGGYSSSTDYVKVVPGVADGGPRDPSVCIGTPATRLTTGMLGQITPGQPNVIRALPTRDNTAGAIIGQIPASGVFEIVGGPQCAEGYLWWQVNYLGTIGWTPEGQGSAYWISPILNSGCDLQLVPRLANTQGKTGRVTLTPGTPNALRDGPGKTGTKVITNIPAGGVFQVIGGPECGDGYRWWQVNYNTTIGWTAEGQDTTYWLEPTN
jgi:hypothetical protein